MANRRSTEVSVPTAIAREATPTVRRVRFSPAAALSGTPPREEEEEEEDEIAGAAHLPQTFLHALPASSLEPETKNPNFPPDHTFPDPLSMGGDLVQGQTPLQVAARLQTSINDNQQLLAKLKAAIWENATGHKRHPWRKREETLPAVAEEEMSGTHKSHARQH